MPPSAASPQIAAIEAKFGGRWHQNHTATMADGSCIFVLQRDGCAQDIMVLRNDLVVADSHELCIPDLGDMYCHSFVDDPALPGLKDIHPLYDHVEVLRYRPGKRATLAATGSGGRQVIIKCLAKNCESVFNRLQAVYPERSSLGFRVSQPVLLNLASRILVQSRLVGEPLQPLITEGKFEHCGAIARAIASLHSSGVVFPGQFDLMDQQRRTERYADLIKVRFPAFSGDVNHVMTLLNRAQDSHAGRDYPLVPIHGSLHSHQWLCSGESLALVDFDRAAMGHPELDFATFLAEWDYEPEAIAIPIQKDFACEMPKVDKELLAFYRAHKHFSKAFKAAKILNVPAAMRKVLRSLDRAGILIKDTAL